MKQITAKGDLPSSLRCLVDIVLNMKRKIYVFELRSGNKRDRIKQLSIEMDLVREVSIDNKTGRYYYIAFGSPLIVDHEKMEIRESRDYILYFYEMKVDEYLSIKRIQDRIETEERDRLEYIQSLVEKGYKVKYSDIVNIKKEFTDAKPID